MPGWPMRRRLFALLAIAIGILTIRTFFKYYYFNASPHSSSCPTLVGDADNRSPSGLSFSELRSHAYLPNGLLLSNPEGLHPIEELIRNAETNWMSKLNKASRSLEEAVAEYARRYDRSPPKGFEKWWAYAQKHKVQLPDEYDTIWQDIEPFWGINPGDLNRIQEAQEEKVDSFTLGKNATFELGVMRVAFSGHPDTWKDRNLLRGADEMLDLLEDIKDELPEFRIVVSPHDNPSLLSDYHVKEALIQAARSGRFVDLGQLPPVANLGFVSACPPGSPARRTEVPIDPNVHPPPRTEKTFIYDHRKAMDVCNHPHLFYYHSQFLPHDVGPHPQSTFSAQFSYCSTTLHHDIQPPSFIAWVEDSYPRSNDLEWKLKNDERLYWRGSNTGMHHSPDSKWRQSQRMRLVSLASEIIGTVDVLMPGPGEQGRVGNGTTIKRAILNPAIMDVAFSGSPVACDQSYCDYLDTQYEWRKPHSATGKEVGDHKYIVDVDGNGWSSRFKRLITTNSLIFKATIYPEWWLDRVQPWVHYIPIQVDLADLRDAYTFFRGGLYGEGNHDHLAETIATAGREWSKAFWRKEDMIAYFYRLLLEYARVMSSDREGMSFSLP